MNWCSSNRGSGNGGTAVVTAIGAETTTTASTSGPAVTLRFHWTEINRSGDPFRAAGFFMRSRCCSRPPLLLLLLLLLLCAEVSSLLRPLCVSVTYSTAAGSLCFSSLLLPFLFLLLCFSFASGAGMLSAFAKNGILAVRARPVVRTGIGTCPNIEPARGLYRNFTNPV